MLISQQCIIKGHHIPEPKPAILLWLHKIFQFTRLPFVDVLMSPQKVHAHRLGYCLYQHFLTSPWDQFLNPSRNPSMQLLGNLILDWKKRLLLQPPYMHSKSQLFFMPLIIASSRIPLLDDTFFLSLLPCMSSYHCNTSSIFRLLLIRLWTELSTKRRW